MSRPIALVLLVVAAAAPQAQDQLPARAGSSVVRVDFYATADGAPVADLTAEDVEVEEDGVAQTIASFEHVHVAPPGTGAAAADAAGRARVFVVFVDSLNTSVESSGTLRIPLVRFLDRVIGPDDLVAVATPETAVADLTFGRKGPLISNIMQSDWSWARGGREGRDPRELLYEQCYPGGAAGVALELTARRREKASLDTLDALVGRLAGAREERKAVLVVSDGWPLVRPDPKLTEAGDARPRRGAGDVFRRGPRPQPPPQEPAPSVGVDRAQCEGDRATLAALDHTQRLRDLSEEANRGNVTFYPISPHGLAEAAPPSGDARRPPAPDQGSDRRVRQDALRFLADNTDGVAVVEGRDADRALERIAGDLSSYYLVTYVSTNTRLDGRFRSLSVRALRPGVRVRTRRGYRGATADELLSRSGSASSGASPLASTPAANTRSQFRIRTSSWVRPSQGGDPSGVFWVVGELDYRVGRELAWTAGAKAEVVVLRADGTEVMSRGIDVETEEGPFTFAVPESGGLERGEYAVRVQITPEAGGAEALTDTARVVVADAVGLGEAVIWRRGPSTGLDYRRTADVRLQRSERLRLEFPTSASASTPAAARMLDRRGNPLSIPLQVTEREDASGGFRWIVVDVALAPFASGEYAIEVTQGGATRTTAFRVGQ